MVATSEEVARRSVRKALIGFRHALEDLAVALFSEGELTGEAAVDLVKPTLSSSKKAIETMNDEIDYLSKRLTNTPVRQTGAVLKCPDDRKNRVVNAQATYPCGGSAVSSGVCEQRHAAERVLSESRFELQHPGSPSEETALEEKA